MGVSLLTLFAVLDFSLRTWIQSATMNVELSQVVTGRVLEEGLWGLGRGCTLSF